MIGDPVLKKPIVALVGCGGRSASNRKLYSVPQRIALALGFCTKASVAQVREVAACVGVQGVLLKPASP